MPINIIDDLEENGEEYDFFQAIRLIERVKKQNSAQDSKPDPKNALASLSRREARAVTTEEKKKNRGHRVLFRPELSLDYADRDIAKIESLPDGSVEISTTFMGLYGISSPLPTYYTEELLDDEWDNHEAPRDFLDIIHQHLYPILFEAWQKYRFAHQTVEQEQDQYWDILYSLIGLADPKLRESSQYAKRYLPYLGLLSQRQKSMLGLRTILRDVLDAPELEIEPCVAREVPIPKDQYALLGGMQVTLGEDATIGQQITDRMGKANIRIKGVSSEQFQSFLGDSEQIDFIRSLSKFYLSQPLDISIVLTLEQDAVVPTKLGEAGWSSLGVDTWLQDQSFARSNEPTEVTLL